MFGPVAAVIARGRRRRLNEGLHELRRPLQGLALILDRSAPTGAAELLEQAIEATAELDCLINGVERGRERVPIVLEELVEAARRRWVGRVEVERASGAGRVRIIGDRRRLAAALDNLIANALEHGSPPVRLRAAARGRAARIEVIDSGGAIPAAAARDPRRGHGLALAARIADEHGGRADRPRPERGRTVARISVPALPGVGDRRRARARG